MKKEIADKWIAALRSGKYKQGKGNLCVVQGKTAKYCCLGVLCHILETPYRKDGECKAYINNTAQLPFVVQKEVGMGSATGYIANQVTSLAKLNDTGSNFKEIADIIEKRWLSL